MAQFMCPMRRPTLVTPSQVSPFQRRRVPSGMPSPPKIISPSALQVRGEFEFVKAKPLADGFVGVPVYEIRGAVLRPFLETRMSIGVNFLIANGFTGQTTETIPRQPNPCPIECVVGVPVKILHNRTLDLLF